MDFPDAGVGQIHMWQVLSGTDPDPKYTRLSFGDRKAVVEILLETKKGLPPFFRPVRQ
jgi:hypothetical protein